MCVTAYGANTSSTHIVLGEVADDIRYIIYKNDVTPVGAKPVKQTKSGWRSFSNMMFWPVPAVFDSIQPVEAKNIVSSLKDIANTIDPPTRGMTLGAPGRAKVIETDLYTLVLAENPTSIPAVLESNLLHLEGPSGQGFEHVLEAFSSVYKSMPVAMMLFKNEEAASGAVLLTYRSLPRYREFYFAPTLEGHGELDLEGLIEADYVISIKTPVGFGQSVWYSNRAAVNESAQPYLPERVIGCRFSDELPNGDFWFRVSDVWKGKLNGVRMVLGEQNDDVRWHLTESGLFERRVEFDLPQAV